MKKGLIVLSALSAIAVTSTANASNVATDVVHAGVGITISPIATTGLSMLSTAEVSMHSNDIVMVKQDAVIALETGVFSLDLQAVIQKLRSSDAELAQLSDEEILMLILEE
ncbi:MAG: hypothetical protein ACLGGX_05865 [Bdellovibrionia bacterium]